MVRRTVFAVLFLLVFFSQSSVIEKRFYSGYTLNGLSRINGDIDIETCNVLRCFIFINIIINNLKLVN